METHPGGIFFFTLSVTCVNLPRESFSSSRDSAWKCSRRLLAVVMLSPPKERQMVLQIE